MTSQRNYLITKLIVITLILVVLSHLTEIFAQKTNDQKMPNVLFIVIDDLNDWIGVLGGHPDAKTPNLDRLAERGVLFTNAHCSAPACNPSRTSLLTGILPSTSGVYEKGQPWPKAVPNATTLTKHFTRGLVAPQPTYFHASTRAQLST